MNRHQWAREIPEPPTASDIDATESRQVLYMGILYPVAKRIRNSWYHETPEGYKPFPLQGRVRPVIERQHARS